MAEANEKEMTLDEKIIEIQCKLNAPKSRYNKFGEFHYRSLEDILEAVKPLLREYGLLLIINDEIVQIGERYYIKATATIHGGNGGMRSATAYAREAVSKPKMDESQITGSASSYARKYALNALLCIDDTKDADTNEQRMQTEGGPKKIDDKTVAVLEEMAKNGNLKKENVLKAYKIESLADLTEEQYADMLRRMNEGKK